VAFSPAGAWNTNADYEDVARPFRMIFEWVPLLLKLTTLFLGIAWLRRALCRQSMDHGDRIAASDLRAMLRSMGATRVLPALLKTMGRDGPIAPMGATPTQIRIAWGEHDRVIPFERYGRPMLERVATAQHQTLAGVGHVPMYDDPQAVAATILEVTAPSGASRPGPMP
jgi:pimeloyl-ACP methyl ester carboxylesterase